MLSSSISVISKFLTQILKLCLSWPFVWSIWFFLAYPAHYLCYSLLFPMSGLLPGANSWPDLFLVLPNCSMLTNAGLWSHLFQTSHSTLASGFQFFSSTIVYNSHFGNIQLFSGLHAPPYSKRSMWHYDVSQFKWHEELVWGSFGSENIFIFCCSSRLIIKKLDLVQL